MAKMIGKGYKVGLVTKEDYATTLRRDEMKSEQRTKAGKRQ